VQVPDSGRKYVVNLKNIVYLVCSHTVVACNYKAKDPFDYIDFKYSVEAYKEAYNHFLLPVSIENLPFQANILPPIAKKQRSEPKTRRIRKGA
jgi:hypothetical protein